MKKVSKHYNYNFQNKKDIKETIEKRYKILIILIVFIICILLSNLFVIQIVRHNFYVSKVEKLSQNVVFSSSTPRGRIYDRNGKLVVDNEAVKVIYYQKPSGVTTKQEIEVAYKLAGLLTLDITKLKESDLRKFWVKNYPEEAKSFITQEEWQLLEERKISNEDIEKYKQERIEKETLEQLSTQDKLAAYIYTLMNQGYSYDEKVIKKVDVTDEEYAKVAENDLLGVDVRLDWQRVYPYGNVFKTILGTVSTTETGIPYELKDYYLNLGYSLNDRVGTSYLEYQYESILKGVKTTYQVLNDGSLKILDEGSRGNDIVLTIDIELQKAVESILEEELIKAKQENNTKYYDHSFVIISDPRTGEILAMAGKQIVKVGEEYKFYDYTPGVITTSATVGSVIKAASHITGYNSGALTIGERRSDECIKIAATPIKCSWTSLGVVDDLTALKYSSNVFQFKTAINVGKGNYQYNQSLNIDPTAFTIYRNTFKEFGLGTYTEIDLPNESLGYKGDSTLPGHLLDFAIGQYDTYTPIQLSQYINTVAMNGYRIKPHLLKSVYRPTKEPLEELLYEIEPVILNKVNTEDKYMQRVRQGLREVMLTSGTGVGYLPSQYNPAGKTGTSESFLDIDGDGKIDVPTGSATYAGYAPYDNPEVSFVVVSPDIYYDEGKGGGRSGVNRRISSRISQKYFDLYK